jgi:hypothetical protein
MPRILVFRVSILFLILLGALCSFIIAARAQPPAAANPPAGAFQSGLPQYGWKVCEDLGEGPVTGVERNVQILRLCRNSGWQVLVHCIDLGMDVPAVGAACEMINGTDFSCGGGVQRMRLFQIVETPAPAPTNTLTPTLTLTPTVTRTAAAAPTQAVTKAVTAAVATAQQATRAAAAATRYLRARPGGRGNLGPALALAALFGGVLLWLAALVLRARAPRQP